MLKRVLVANRGEIACRVIRACHALGVQAVAVHSDADAGAPHVRMADEAVRIGPTPAAESYLRQDRILAAAEATGADAVHPGYGFMSESAGFARAVAKAGLVFVGPPPEAMETLGDKVKARALAIREGVPVAPGSEGALRDADEALEVAQRVGCPVMLKAAAGGGGMGMRVARSAGEVRARFDEASAQALSAFGDGAVFLERFLERPRHVEVQVLGDAHGTTLHLGERECSIQRRHQKLVEEAPSPALEPGGRATLGALAVRLARAGGYVNAGTMEFLMQDGRCFFNEVNTRLQVEHPVTEMVTGIDLVAWQLRIAAGERLTLRQEDVRFDGHAIECRINAEDPYHGFRPSPGTVTALDMPDAPGVRVDHGLMPGFTVPGAYDSLVAKVIVHAPDRQGAMARIDDALARLVIEGFPTTVAFHRALLTEPAFVSGDLSTRFLDENDVAGKLAARGALDAARAAAAIASGAKLGIGAWAARHATPPARTRAERRLVRRPGGDA